MHITCMHTRWYVTCRLEGSKGEEEKRASGREKEKSNRGVGSREDDVF